ncbi:MAG TPA: helicase C-terminal domain-containing protein [Ktedonobacterales bacterium]|jgi:Rad3-related DNA helicase
MTDPAPHSSATKRKRSKRVTAPDVQEPEQTCGQRDDPAPDVAQRGDRDERQIADEGERQDASTSIARRDGSHADAHIGTDGGKPSLSAAVEADLRAGGILSNALPGYEERPAQIAMARTVAAALEAGEHAAVEASTGTGKSFAYLLALVRSGKVALVSTANKALQEQLFYKDIPFVQRHVQDFQAALVKGMGNYLCLDRLDEERGFQRLVRQPAFERMLDLMDGDNWDGDLDLLPQALPPDSRVRIAADSDQCAWRSCPFFRDCYVRKMRQRAEDAQVIVVNHTLLLIDAAMDNWLLPSRDVVILDEAHHLEEEATRAFTVTVTPGRVASLLALRRVREHADAGVIQEAAAANVEVWDALERRVAFGPRGRVALTQPLEDGLRLASLLDDLATSLQRNRPEQVDEKEEQLYEKVVKRTRALSVEARTAFGVADTAGHVYYAERSFSEGGGRRGLNQFSVSAAPLGVSELLGDKLFRKVPVIATSATLAIGGTFAFFRQRVGLPEPPATREAVLPLAFDYPTHALLYVPRLRYEPAFGAGGDAYLGELADQMRLLAEASRGRAFLLFSSQRALAAVRDQIADRLAEQGCTVLVQGAGMSRVELVRRFREAARPVLFGLKSFWEGVDIAGETLSLVVVDKLPFAPPDDPIQEARVARMKAAGENWFGGYTLPLAILQLKQGLGRLLRTHEDRGVMAILDTRLHTKSYGRQVLAALPPARRTIDIADVRAFFADANDDEG